MASRTERAAWLAVAGIASIPILVPIVEGRLSIASLPLDAVIVSVLVALAASVPLVRARGLRALPVTGIARPALLFLGLTAVGTAFLGSPAALMTWMRYACYFALVPIIGLVATDPRHRRLLLWAILAGGTFTLLHATYQYLNPGMVESIGMQGLSGDVSTRVYSTFENPNFFAEYLVLLFSVSLALAFTERRLPQMLAVGIGAYTGAVLLLTYTRGSWVALALGVALTVALVNWRLLIPLAAAAGVSMFLLPGVLSRLLTIVSLDGTASFRLQLWRIAGEVVSNHPWVGVGLGNFYDGFQEVVLSQPALSVGYAFYGAHNSYFQIAAETGVLGGLAFVWAVLALCRAGIAYGAARYEQPRDRLQAAALVAGIVAFSVNALTSNAFQHPKGAVFFFLVAGLAAGVGASARPREVRAPAEAAVLHPVFSTSFARRAVVAFLDTAARSASWDRLLQLPKRKGVLQTSYVARLLFGGQGELQEGLT